MCVCVCVCVCVLLGALSLWSQPPVCYKGHTQHANAAEESLVLRGERGRGNNESGHGLVSGKRIQGAPPGRTVNKLINFGEVDSDVCVVSVCRGLVIILACTVSVSRLLQGALAYATYARAAARAYVAVTSNAADATA